MSKSACDYEVFVCVCVCAYWQSRGEEVTTDYPDYLLAFLGCLSECLGMLVGGG